MGRKQKRGGKAPQQSAAAGATAASAAGGKGDQPQAPTLSKASRREVTDLISQLLEVCSQPPASGAKEWEDYPEIHGLVEKIRKIQSGTSYVQPNREEKFASFVDWLQTNGVDTSSTEIANFDGFGYGLKAARDLKMDELFLSIPRKVMMTTDTAKASVLGSLIEEDRILQVMPNVTLALHVLCERRSPDSFWKPYLDILPSSYETPLYFSLDDLQLLKGSPALGDSICQYRNIARQYAYFYGIFQKKRTPGDFPLKEHFTFDDYRWAVSTVMTRQNQIPTKDGTKISFGLIPLWDMCNHTEGKFTADFSPEKDSSECYALKDFAKGDQVYIFYGARSNAEFFVHNGFVYPDNEQDRLCIKLGISKGDSLHAQKTEVLKKLGLAPSRSYFLHKGELPVDGDLLAFLRVFSMEEGVLQQYLEGGQDVEQLKEVETETKMAGDLKVWSFLEGRASLLLRAYPSQAKEDEELLKKADLPQHHRMAVQLRLCEKKILSQTVEYCASKKQHLSEENGS